MIKYMMRIAKVVFFQAWSDEYDYICDESISLGDLVLVPMKSKLIQGMVCEIIDIAPVNMYEKTKTVSKILRTRVLTAENIAFARKIARFNFVKMGEVLKLMITSEILKRKNQMHIPAYFQYEGKNWSIEEFITKKHQKTLISGLNKKSIAPIYFLEHADLKSIEYLTEDQRDAMKQLYEYGDAKQHNIKKALLEGATGSGKTEVYIELISRLMKDSVMCANENAIAKQKNVSPTNADATRNMNAINIDHDANTNISMMKADQNTLENKMNSPIQILILMPEVSLTFAFVERLAKHFGIQPLIWNHKTSATGKQAMFDWATSDESGIIIGTRSAIFLPFKHLKCIIVDEEHDDSYKQSEGLRYHAKDCAEFMCELYDAMCLYVSATPSMDLLIDNACKHIKLTRQPQHGHAKIVIADMSKQKMNDKERRELNAKKQSQAERNVSDSVMNAIDHTHLDESHDQSSKQMDDMKIVSQTSERAEIIPQYQADKHLHDTQIIGQANVKEEIHQKVLSTNHEQQKHITNASSMSSRELQDTYEDAQIKTRTAENNTLTIEKPKQEKTKRHLISTEALEYIRDRASKKELCLLFMNRKGFASVIMCYSCRVRMVCKTCSVGLVYYKNKNAKSDTVNVDNNLRNAENKSGQTAQNVDNRQQNIHNNTITDNNLRSADNKRQNIHTNTVLQNKHELEHTACGIGMCHYCGYTQRISERCNCGNPWSFSGTGIEHIESLLLEVMPELRTRIVHSDIGKTELAEIMLAANNREVDVLIGTQMLIQGHNIEHLTFICILDCDLSLAMPYYNANERTYEIFTQARGRAGRGRFPGVCMLQTYNPKNKMIENFTNGNMEIWKQDVMKERERYFWPPYCNLLAIILESNSNQFLQAYTRALHSKLLDMIRNQKLNITLNHITELTEVQKQTWCHVLGPTPSAIHKIKGKYRNRFLVKYKNFADVERLMKIWIDKTKEVRVIIDNHPENFI